MNGECLFKQAQFQESFENMEPLFFKGSNGEDIAVLILKRVQGLPLTLLIEESDYPISRPKYLADSSSSDPKIASKSSYPQQSAME